MLIAQISDIPVRPTGQLCHGLVDSNQMFVNALRHIEQLERRPDLVLALP